MGYFQTQHLLITIGKLEVFPNPPMHALCIIHSYPPVHATYPFLPKPPFLPVYSQVFLVCQVMLTIQGAEISHGANIAATCEKCSQKFLFLFPLSASAGVGPSFLTPNSLRTHEQSKCKAKKSGH